MNWERITRSLKESRYCICVWPLKLSKELATEIDLVLLPHHEFVGQKWIIIRVWGSFFFLKKRQVMNGDGKQKEGGRVWKREARESEY